MSYFFQDIFLQWRTLRRATLHVLLQIARSLEGKSRDVDIANLSGSVAGAAGGIVSVTGLALIPVTLGASLIVTGVGLGLGIAGGLTSGGAIATDFIVNSCARTEFDKLVAMDHMATMQTQGALNQMQNVAVRFSTWESKRPVVAASGHGTCMNDNFVAFIRVTKALASVGKNCEECVENGMTLWRLWYAALDSGVEVLTLARNGGTGAKIASTEVRAVSAASITFAAASLVLDIGMIGYLSYRLHTGSKNTNAAEIREIRRILQQELRVLQHINNKLGIKLIQSNDWENAKIAVCAFMILIWNKLVVYWRLGIQCAGFWS